MKNVMMEMGSEDLDRMKAGVESEIEAGASEEDAGFMSLVDGAQVSPKVLIGLIGALNKVLPLFGLPKLEGKDLSPELVRGLSMVAQAVTDALGQEEAPAELEFSIDDMKGGDQAVIVIAGKLDRLSKTPSFKKFLKQKPSTPSEQPPSGDQVVLDKVEETDTDALFASRM
jgi:hypothetical protein